MKAEGITCDHPDQVRQLDSSFFKIIFLISRLKVIKIQDKLRKIPASELMAQGKIKEHRVLPCFPYVHLEKIKNKYKNIEAKIGEWASSKIGS